MIGPLALDFIGTYEDDVSRLSERLDEYDQTYNRDTGESLLLVDGLRCSAYFETVDQLK